MRKQSKRANSGIREISSFFLIGLAVLMILTVFPGRRSTLRAETEEGTGTSEDNQSKEKSEEGNLGADPEKPEPRRRMPVRRIVPGEEGPSSASYTYDENHFDLNLEEKAELLERIQWKLAFWTSFNYFNNSDLRVRDDTSEESVRNTDDRMSFGLAGAELDFFFPINDRLDFRLDIWKAGLYGHDQLGGRDNINDSRLTFTGSNTVNFGQVWFRVHFFKDPTEDEMFDMKIGRQFFDIGGAIDREYFMHDVLDAAVFNVYGFWGKFDIVAVDYFASGARTDEVNFVQYLSFDEIKTRGFDGRTNTYRSGGVYSYSFLGDMEKHETHLDLRAFYFLARMGGLRDGGADRCNNGTTCNEPDNDFSVMRGFRINSGYGEYVRGSFTFAQSYGVDRKPRSATYESQDVDAAGNAWSLELEFSALERKIRFTPTYFYAQGGKYLLDGRQYSHGFVGFKAEQSGGILADLNWGNHPTAYTDDDGIDDLPFGDTYGSPSRKSGTEIKHLGLAVDLGLLWDKLAGVELLLKWWRYNDTNQIDFLGERSWSFNRIWGNPDSPSFYEQEILFGLATELYPQRASRILAYRRFGMPMAEEYNIGLDWEVRENWRVWATWGVLRPMRYFSTPGLVNGAPEGNALFTGFQVGTMFYF